VETIFPSFPSCAAALEQVIREKKAALVVIDPLSAFFDTGIQTNNDASVRQALAPLSEVAQRTGAAILLIRHLNKDTSKVALYRGGGSIGIIGAARSAMVVAHDPDDPKRRILAHTKLNLGEFPEKALAYRVVHDDVNNCAHITWEGEVNYTADDLLSAGKGEGKLEAAKKWLEVYLATGPRESGQVANDGKVDGHSWGTLMRASKDLDVCKSKALGGGQKAPWIWRLPGGDGRNDDGIDGLLAHDSDDLF
jgi:hypothetical protein